MERNNRKKYIHIDCETGSNEIFAMLEKTESEIESDTENLLEYSDTEYLTEEPIPVNKEESHELVTPEATVHVEDEVLDIDEPLAKPAYFRYRLCDVDFKAARLSINALSQNDPAVFTRNDVRQFILFLMRPAAHSKQKTVGYFLSFEILKWQSRDRCKIYLEMLTLIRNRNS